MCTFGILIAVFTSVNVLNMTVFYMLKIFREMLMWTQKKFVVLANGEHEVTGVQFNVFFFRWLPFSILASVSNESF